MSFSSFQLLSLGAIHHSIFNHLFELVKYCQYPDSRREPSDHAGPERPLWSELHAGHVAQLDSGIQRGRINPITIVDNDECEDGKALRIYTRAGEEYELSLIHI